MSFRATLTYPQSIGGMTDEEFVRFDSMTPEQRTKHYRCEHEKYLASLPVLEGRVWDTQEAWYRTGRKQPVVALYLKRYAADKEQLVGWFDRDDLRSIISAMDNQAEGSE